MLEINEFRGYETKIEESERAGSRQKLNRLDVVAQWHLNSFVSSMKQDALKAISSVLANQVVQSVNCPRRSL